MNTLDNFRKECSRNRACCADHNRVKLHFGFLQGGRYYWSVRVGPIVVWQRDYDRREIDQIEREEKTELAIGIANYIETKLLDLDRIDSIGNLP